MDTQWSASFLCSAWSRLSPTLSGLNSVCLLQLLASNCLLNCEVFSFKKYFSHACHKSNLEIIFSRSSSRSWASEWKKLAVFWQGWDAQGLSLWAVRPRCGDRRVPVREGGCQAQRCRWWNPSEQLWADLVVCQH